MDLLSVTPEFWLENEADCLELLNSEECWNSIPLLNVANLQDLPDNKLVRFYGMVQDMFNPEYYFEKYEVVNEVSFEKQVRNGKYMDVASCKDMEVIDYESGNNVTGDRQTLVVISVPGLNEWIEKLEESDYISNSTQENISHKPKKRSLDLNEQIEASTLNVAGTSENQSNKKQCVNGEKVNLQETVVSREHFLNFPLPERSGKACHVKIYKDNDNIHLNNVIEFVGFLSVNPVLADISTEEDDNKMEVQTHNPPPSLIPRIHCVQWKKLTHNNPLVSKTNLTKEKMIDLKNELMIVLTQLFMGDVIAAEYFLYHLISRIYLRNELLPLGKFTLNISHIPYSEVPDYGKHLYEFIKILTSKSHYFPMTLENMNESAFIPKKDYECDRITSGLLQLSPNTHLILDETRLTPGRLNESGVKALTALVNTIRDQKVAYDFKYFPMEFECDIPILILSEGKSLLPSDFHIILKSEVDHVTTFTEICEAAKNFLKPDLLNELRAYLTVARHAHYELASNVEELVQREFVRMRQERKFTADDLHSLLILARLVCLSEGKISLDEDCWRRACSLEEERKRRLI